MATLLSNAPADPAELFGEEIADLMLEAKNWLDGTPIANKQQAEAVSSLLNRLRRVSKDADEARKAEKKPHDEAAKAVQAKWQPILSKADLAASAAKEVLAPWLLKIEEENQRAAEVARAEAERMAAAAREAHQAASGNLEATEEAERVLKAADAAQKHANAVEKLKAHATGGERAVGLVDRYWPELTDAMEALRHYRTADPDSLKDWLLEQARVDVRAGVRAIPGFEIKHERIAR